MRDSNKILISVILVESLLTMALDTGILSTGAVLLGKKRPPPVDCPKGQVFLKGRGCVCTQSGKNPVEGFCEDELYNTQTTAYSD